MCSLHLVGFGSRIRIVASECLYLYESCAPNPSGHLPGLKAPITNNKCRFWGLGGFGGNFPPHPGAGIAIMGYTWVSGWYPAATEFGILKKAY